MSGTLRIALLGYRSNPHSGGQGIYIAALSRALADAGHQVDVISGPPWPQLDSRVRLVPMMGLDLFAHPNRAMALRPAHFRSLTDLFEYCSVLTGGFPEPYAFGRRVYKWISGRGPGYDPQGYDIVHDNQSLCYGLLKVRRLGLPVVATIHHPIHRDLQIALQHADTWQHRLLIRRWYSFLRMQMRVVSRLPHLVTVSETAAADIADCFRIPAGRITTVYNGIDCEAFRPEPAQVRRQDLLLTTISSDQPLKGLDYLLRAMALLARDRPQLQLIVIGSPREDGSTEQRIRELGLDARVQFRHGVSQQAMARLYAQATLVVVPSLYEGFGLPAGEAMACATPVVATCAGALPEVVGDAGVLVPAADTEALRAAIAELLANPDARRRLGEAGRRRIHNQFDWRVTARRMTDYYHEVLRQHRFASGAV